MEHGSSGGSFFFSLLHLTHLYRKGIWSRPITAPRVPCLRFARRMSGISGLMTKWFSLGRRSQETWLFRTSTVADELILLATMIRNNVCWRCSKKLLFYLTSFKLSWTKEVRNGTNYTALSFYENLNSADLKIPLFPFLGFFAHRASSKSTLVVFTGNLVPQMATLPQSSITNQTLFMHFLRVFLLHSGRGLHVILAIRTTPLRPRGNSNI